jgi:hydroxyethylthiazole kinase-like sugar kinase family protein
MITEAEQERLDAIRDAASELTDMMAEGMESRGIDVSSEEGLKAYAMGTQLATYDAFFAIREGTEWRGLTDPKEIARRILRDIGIGE